MITDFDSFERSAMRRGADVTRLKDMSEAGAGMAWDTEFQFRGKSRKARLTLTQYDPATGIAIEATSPSLEADFIVDLLALSRTRTRMSVELDLRPRNLSARLMMQSLKLAKTSLTKRFKLRVAEYSKDMEDRYTRTA